MARRADVVVSGSMAATYTGAGSQYLVQANNGALYLVYIDAASDVLFAKSTDGGVTWSVGTVVFAGTTTQLSVWYDRWSSVSGDLIHLAYTDSGTADTTYRTIDTASSDALSTQTVIFAGVSTAAGGHLSITRAKGGNVYCKAVIDAGAEGGFFRLPNANVPNGAWDAARTADEAIATNDAMILLPDLTAADTQDIMAVFWDTSANEISRKLYDDSANSWSETSIATSMTKTNASLGSPQFDATVDIANTRILMVAWSALDTVNADLRCWVITNSAITETTANVVLNSTDDQGWCAISLDTTTGYWTVCYVGESGGSETFATAVNLYSKTSQDAGATWGTETQLWAGSAEVRWLASLPRRTGPLLVAHSALANSSVLVRVNVDRTQPRAAYVAGIF